MAVFDMPEVFEKSAGSYGLKNTKDLLKGCSSTQLYKHLLSS